MATTEGWRSSCLPDWVLFGFFFFSRFIFVCLVCLVFICSFFVQRRNVTHFHW